MTTIISSSKDRDSVVKAAELSDLILAELIDAINSKSTPATINELAGSLCKKYKVVPSFLGEPSAAGDFPANLCLMVNNEVIHNIPISTEPFKDEDIIHIDFGIAYNGFNTDHGRSIYFGKDSEKLRLINTAKLSIQKAIEVVESGAYTGDISARIQGVTELSGFISIKNFCGHAVGRELHEAPKIPFVGIKGTGTKLRAGMILAIENWITPGNGNVIKQSDGWSLTTQDGALGAFYEALILVEDDSYTQLTKIL